MSFTINVNLGKLNEENDIATMNMFPSNEQDEMMCRKIHGRKPSLFYNIVFITFNKTNDPKCNTTTPRFARGKNIFDMRYIFIPIHHCILRVLLSTWNR